ncbi:MAG: AraC family transcriptional regulator [Planctomycetota bacterium]
MPEKRSAKIDLSKPPRIVSAGRSTHGDRPVERYVLDEIWCLHWYRYRFTLEIDGRPHRVGSGTVSLLRPGLRLVYRYPRAGCRHQFCLFTLPGGGVAPAKWSAHYPVLTDGSALSPEFFRLFDRVVDERVSRPSRAKAALWEMLWELTDAGHAEGAAAQGPAEVTALQIRTRLNEPLRVADLAEEVGLSHNQLTRLFRARYGQTVVGYLQEQRMATAERMLCETRLPMKMIAAAIGLDAQQFNKAVRRGLGASPTAVRERGRGGELSDRRGA